MGLKGCGDRPQTGELAGEEKGAFLQLRTCQARPVELGSQEVPALVNATLMALLGLAAVRVTLRAHLPSQGWGPRPQLR